jgi:MFS family permease
VAFVFRLPDSPRWLAEKDRYDQALEVLTTIDGPEYARREIEEIKASLLQETGGWSELFAPGMRYALLIGLLLALFNNWTGWSVIGGYIPMLFEMSGMEDRARAILQFAVTYGFMGLMTLVSLVLMDRVGRRPLWLFASLLMAVITAVTGLVFHFHVTGPVVLLVIVLCTVPHGIALGGIPWLMMSELFPTRIRAKAVAVTTTVLWIAIFSGAYLFPSLASISIKLVGSLGGTFWLFTGICILAFLFGLLMMPETKGRTLEEIAGAWKRPRS